MKFNCDPVNMLPYAFLSTLENLNLGAFDVDFEQVDFPSSTLIDRLMQGDARD